MSKQKKVRPCKPHGTVNCPDCKARVSEKSKANLIPWQPGQSGNPNGIRKNPLTERMKAGLEEKLPENVRVGLGLQEGATWADAIVMRTLREAVKGNQGAMNSLADRVEGTPTRRLEVSGPDRKQIELIVRYEKPRKTPKE